MNKLRIAILSGLIIAAVNLCGCVVALGNHDADKITRTTRGQELMDLKRARDTGAITEAEYEAQKRKLLEAPEKK